VEGTWCGLRTESRHVPRKTYVLPDMPQWRAGAAPAPPSANYLSLALRCGGASGARRDAVASEADVFCLTGNTHWWLQHPRNHYENCLICPTVPNPLCWPSPAVKLPRRCASCFSCWYTDKKNAGCGSEVERLIMVSSQDGSINKHDNGKLWTSCVSCRGYWYDCRILCFSISNLAPKSCGTS